MNIAGAALAAATLASIPSIARASSHREAPAISEDPAVDNTDVWAWVNSGSHDTLNVVAAYNPLEEPSGGPNFNKFSDNALYEIHITRGGSSLADVVTYQFQFSTSGFSKTTTPDNRMDTIGGGKEFFIQISGQQQTFDVWKIQGNTRTRIAQNVPVAPPNIGPRTQAVAYQPNMAGAAYNDEFAATFIRGMGTNNAEGRVFAGPRDDGFYVDLGGAFDLANLRPQGQAQDGVSGYNCHAIAIQIPTTKLTANGMPPGNTASADTTLGVWASASRPKFLVRRNRPNRPDSVYGPWVQVSRQGLPLINEAVIGLQDKDEFNAAHPSNDVRNFGAYFLNPVIVRDAEAVGFYAMGSQGAGLDPTPFKFNRMDIINIISLIGPNRQITAIGDVLRVDMATDSAFPNGRPIPGGPEPDQEPADVTDVILSVFLTGGMRPVTDGVQYNDRDFLPRFPYLALPWEGYSEGHGRPTP